MAENKDSFIVDTSVLLKFVVNEEEDMVQAERLRKLFIEGDIQIAVPSIFYYELTNTLIRKISAHEAMKAVSFFRLTGLQEYDFDDILMSHALSLLTDSLKVSVYDASYHALAIQKKATFITADKKYYQHMKHHGHVKLLSEWK